MQRIGIFGGTFNPPHIGHVAAAKAFIESVKLNELLIIPNYAPPHKEYSGSVEPDKRLQMCRIAFSHIDGVKVSDVEILRGGKSYTAETLLALSSPNRKLYLLCGTDMFLTLDKWRDPETIFKLATICYIRRENKMELSRAVDDCVKKYKLKYNADILFVGGDAIEISSTELRQELEIKRFSKFIPQAVLDYINIEGLYL